MRTLRDMTFNETEIATSMNVRSLSQKITTLTTSTEITEITKITEIIEKVPDINDADIADANDANIIFENIENAPLESIVESAPVRRSIRHRKATFKAVGTNAVGAAEAPSISADEEESEKEDYLPKIMIAKSITANEDKLTYEETMAGSEKF
jgi:hypothetical protein